MVLNKEVFICDIKFPLDSFDARITDSVAVFMFDELAGNINLWTLDDEACLGGAGVKASWTLMLSTYVGDQIIYV